MKSLKYIILTLGIVAGFGLFVPVNVAAAGVFDNACTVDPNSVLCTKKTDSATTLVGVVVNALLFILGAISVLIIIIGGFRYVTSMGDAKNIESAKNTILYAVIGLVVAFLAYAIVNFVISALFK